MVALRSLKKKEEEGVSAFRVNELISAAGRESSTVVFGVLNTDGRLTAEHAGSLFGVSVDFPEWRLEFCLVSLILLGLK